MRTRTSDRETQLSDCPTGDLFTNNPDLVDNGPVRTPPTAMSPSATADPLCGVLTDSNAIRETAIRETMRARGLLRCRRPIGAGRAQSDRAYPIGTRFQHDGFESFLDSSERETTTDALPQSNSQFRSGVELEWNVRVLQRSLGGCQKNKKDSVRRLLDEIQFGRRAPTTSRLFTFGRQRP